jgi:Ca2+-binding RTX toxin-like protein
MANITGTAGADILTGTQDFDRISALAGDDLINSSGARDTIDGGAGFDTVSYDNDSLFGGPFAPDSTVLYVTYRPISGEVEKQSSVSRGLYQSDSLSNIEKVVGKPRSRISLSGAASDDRVSYDLSNNKMTIEGSAGSRSYGIEKFQFFDATNNQDRFLGNAESNQFSGLAGDDTFAPSGGDDVFLGGAGNDTADYGALGQTVRLRSVTPVGNSTGVGINVIKGNGTDGVGFDVETIIAPAGRQNIFAVGDQSSGQGVKVDLSQDKVDNITIKNLVHVTGGIFDDQIIGNAADNNLRGNRGADSLTGGDGNDKIWGGAGADTLNGGNGNDILTGTNESSKGVGELDSLTGGGGGDQFVLGDTKGSYYKGNGSSDFATITDFNLGDRLTLGEQETYSIQLSNGGVNLFVTTNGTSDQIASIQFNASAQKTLGSLASLQGTTFQSNNALLQSAFGTASASSVQDSGDPLLA